MERSVPKIKIIRVPGTAIDAEVDYQLSIGEILNEVGISINHEIEAVFVGNNKVSKESITNTYIIGGVIIIAKGARGEAPTPKLKEAIAFLTNRGFIKEQAKGDHIKFTKPKFPTIILNPDNRDRKHICLGSAKSMAKAFRLTLSELYKEVVT